MPSSVPDTYALHAIKDGRLIVKVDEGEIWWPSGRRAESVDNRSGYGSVLVSTGRPQVRAMAHRLVWIAAYGPIPDGLQVNHKNRRRWDNRIANLELVTPAGQNRHWQDMGYDAVGGNVDPDWLARLDKGERGERDPLSSDLRRLGYATALDKFV